MVVAIATRMSNVVAPLDAKGKKATQVATDPTAHDACANLHASRFPFGARGMLS